MSGAVTTIGSALGDRAAIRRIVQRSRDQQLDGLQQQIEPIRNRPVFDRAKKLAIKRVIDGGARGVCTTDLIESIKQEYKEHEDLPNTTNPDDWAKISGKKGERIVFIRTLVNEQSAEDVAGGKAIERVATGQYL